jgi:hypothetical protein
VRSAGEEVSVSLPDGAERTLMAAYVRGADPGPARDGQDPTGPSLTG